MPLWRQDNLCTGSNIMAYEVDPTRRPRRAWRHRWTDPCRQRRVSGMMQCMTSLAAALCSVALLDACSGGAGSGVGDDGRKAAIQTLLDSAQVRPSVMVASGKNCPGFMSNLPSNIRAFNGIREAHVRPDGRCFDITWEASANVQPLERMGPLGPINGYGAPVGRYVIDKVGDNVTGADGTTTAPYRAHFEIVPLGSELQKAGMWNGKRPDDVTDGHASLHKDADGKWVAQQ